MVIYTGRIASLDPFEETSETRGRGLFAPDDAMKVPWVQQAIELYEAAWSAVEEP